MNAETKQFELKKTFGIDVLLKLTKETASGVKAFEYDGNYTFNVSAVELSKAVNSTLAIHNIHLAIN